MKQKLLYIAILTLIFTSAKGQSWIRINQLGYLPESVKVAVFISQQNSSLAGFEVCDAITDKIVFKGKPVICSGEYWGMKSAARLNFSALSAPGGYYIKTGNIKSEPFRIGNDVYNGTAGFILNYIRQQRCGYNPFLADSCHVHDGILVDHPSETGRVVDVVGGWHDASDHLRYTTTTANSVYQMLFAWSKSPSVYQDEYDASGSKGSNGIPDILDEAKWGLQWLMKMNPDSGIMYNQVADDRDHRGFRLPTEDTATYGLGGTYRPVYFVTGKSQGLSKYKNRTTGVSSTAGKFSSAFAMGAQIFKDSDPVFAEILSEKAIDAWEFGLTDLGTTQTACTVSPYFYEEDNYTDDLELAAWELYKLTGDKQYLKKADYWGALEPVTPWIEKDTARHYQYYPFVNLGHANIALSATEYSERYIAFMRSGLKMLNLRDQNDPFRVSIPFIWCSNNYVAAALTQCRLYYEATGDKQFAEMEASLRDWLFGCNPWGTSMISGLPSDGDYPLYPHSAVTKYLKVPTTGGLVDGPVYTGIYTNLKGLTLFNPDSYADFQKGKVVYHDDIGDYSTNEPTLDGTASLSYYLSSLEEQGKKITGVSSDVLDSQGAVIRKGVEEKSIYLVFSADTYGEGADHILSVLDSKNIRGSFFLTGNYLRNKSNSAVLKRMISGNHYVGPHSDKHLLYCTWEKRDSLLVTRAGFYNDLKANYVMLQKAGVKDFSNRVFLPPYEWYNNSIVSWSADLGVNIVNFTPGTGTNADYTTPDMKNYLSSEQLMTRLKKYEEENGLNGAIILIHLGTDPKRTDKFYNKLGDIIDCFTAKGYSFNKL